jgi:hypothetical protein
VSTLIALCLVIFGGARVRDGLRLRQQELVLSKLPERDAVAYYEVLRRRVRSARILRAVALVSLWALIYAFRHGLVAALTSR